MTHGDIEDVYNSVRLVLKIQICSSKVLNVSEFSIQASHRPTVQKFPTQ